MRPLRPIEWSVTLPAEAYVSLDNCLPSYQILNTTRDPEALVLSGDDGKESYESFVAQLTRVIVASQRTNKE